MRIEEKIVTWSRTQHPWQQEALRRFVLGETPTDEEYADISEKLIHAKPFGAPLTLDDMPTRGSSNESTLRLVGIRNLRSIDVLAEQQTLAFAETGLTVVYGDNGSGKSGYARVIKEVARARHRDTLRSNIFAAKPTVPAEATFLVARGDATSEIRWPAHDAKELSSIGFYDTACGSLYLTAEGEMGYRPAALSLLGLLANACEKVQKKLDDQLLANQQSAQTIDNLHPSTRAGTFLASIHARSDKALLEKLCTVPSDIDAQIERLETEAARLRSTDATKERDALLLAAKSLERLEEHMLLVLGLVDAEAEEALVSEHAALWTARNVAENAFKDSFESEPLSGVGSDTWKVLWLAAKDYAVEGASLEGGFPGTDADARCVLCQQELDDPAKERLRRFEAFVQNKVQLALAAAENAFSTSIERLEGLQPESSEVLVVLDSLSARFREVTNASRAFLARCERRRTDLLSASRESVWTDLEGSFEPEFDFDLEELAKAARAQAAEIDIAKHQTTLKSTIEQCNELKGAKSLRDAKVAVLSEISRLELRTRIETAKKQTSTRTISETTRDLLREHMTPEVLRQFNKETENLRLGKVTLADLGVERGQLRHKAALAGVVQKTELTKVLSEGEQRALGLAGFFTEAQLDESRSALVLDDPVCSMDHRRRAYVAQRLAEFAQDRQVIVFTHDLAFVAALSKAAEGGATTCTPRSLEVRGSGETGLCREYHPWKAKDLSQRLSELSMELGTIARIQKELSQEDYDKQASDWAGKLSETWERMIVVEVIGHVFDIGTLEARPKQFRLLAKITDEDNTEFQASYGQVSQWARRHDKSLETNFVAPSIEDMERELSKVKSWFTRVKKYRN